MTRTTAAEYAKAQGVSVSTARRRLEALCEAGKATRKVSFEEHWSARSRVNYGTTPPPHKVVDYWIAEAA